MSADTLPPLDARTARLLDQAVQAVGEQHRSMIESVYSLGCIDGQIQALDRAKASMALADTLQAMVTDAKGGLQ